MYEYCAQLIKVIDGDTIDAKIDLGFGISIEKRVRLVGIDAPEVRTLDIDEKSRGKRAKRRLKVIFRENNNKFTIKSHGVGKFGRCLGEIFVKNKSINEALVKEGYAKNYKKEKRKWN